MSQTQLHITKRVIGKKLIALALLALTAVASFASLGDGRKKSATKSPSLSSKSSARPGSFSLRSGYNFRGNQVLNTPSPERKVVIRLNTNVTMQRGSNSFTIPLKKNVLLGNVKLSIDNKQFQRN
jgi:hypothetical protein